MDNATREMLDMKLLDEIQEVRSKNNINWMDVLRLAFRHSPDEARELVGRINSDDQRISELFAQLAQKS
ncbi:MAG: hypothetical protein CL398_01755 [Acidiferrobacteraceae bacterium]|nr:hypothetical protein [Acidiferrobacteraceae bacterium]|tara:strand:+ start:663 stop:869 length:207 start_codon:yes stop_codon:yes gene_type:complete